MSGQPGAVRIESTPVASNAPFESLFAPSAVSTFTTNFVLVTAEKCYVKTAPITLQKKLQNLSIRLLLVRYISSDELRGSRTRMASRRQNLWE